MYYKVYAQNCKAVEPIKEIAAEKLDDEIYPLVNLAIENGLIEFPDNDQVINKAYADAKAQLEEYKILSCGDYCIVKQNDAPQKRPNMCGFDTFIFED